MPETDLEKMRHHACEVADFLKTLANENRILILCCLLDGEQSVGQINQHISISASALSQHLAWLREAGLVTTRRQSQTIFYTLADDKVQSILILLKQLYCQ